MTMTNRLIILGVLAVLLGGTIVLKQSREAGRAEGGNLEADSLSEVVDLATLPPADGGDEAPAAPAPTPADPSKLPLLVDLGSDTCVPCKLMAPILKEFKKDYANIFTVEFIDAKKNRPAAALYGIRVIPTQIFYDAAGEELFRHEGFMSKEAILAKWLEHGVDIRK